MERDYIVWRGGTVEGAWLVDLFDWIETGLVWLADGAGRGETFI